MCVFVGLLRWLSTATTCNRRCFTIPGNGIALLPPASWAHHPNLDEYYFLRSEQARALLAKAGYPDGMDITMWVQPAAKTYNPNASKTAQLIRGDLARIGINVQLVETRWLIMRLLSCRKENMI